MLLLQSCIFLLYHILTLPNVNYYSHKIDPGRFRNSRHLLRFPLCAPFTSEPLFFVLSSAESLLYFPSKGWSPELQPIKGFLYDWRVFHGIIIGVLKLPSTSEPIQELSFSLYLSILRVCRAERINLYTGSLLSRYFLQQQNSFNHMLNSNTGACF